MVFVLHHLGADAFELLGDGRLVVVVEAEDPAALALALAGDVEAHRHVEAVGVGAVEDFLTGGFAVVGAPRAERVGAVRGQPLDVAELQPRALDVERLAVDVQLVVAVVVAELDVCGRRHGTRFGIRGKGNARLRIGAGDEEQEAEQAARRGGEACVERGGGSHGSGLGSGKGRAGCRSSARSRHGGPDELGLELLERLALRLGHDHQDEHQTRRSEEAIDQERQRTP